MAKIRVTCVVPEKYEVHRWPDTFDSLPRRGDFIRPVGSDIELVVDKVVHKSTPVAGFDGLTVETRVQLYLMPPNNPLLG